MEKYIETANVRILFLKWTVVVPKFVITSRKSASVYWQLKLERVEKDRGGRGELVDKCKEEKR